MAEEVRSLALRAKEAASRTEELIRQSVKETGEGETVAKQVAGALQEITAGVSRVSDIVAEIAAGARDQSSALTQVTHAVAEMDRVTQQNAASAEQSSSTTSELSAQARMLSELVGQFALAGDGAPPGGKAAGPRGPSLRAVPERKAMNGAATRRSLAPKT